MVSHGQLIGDGLTADAIQWRLRTGRLHLIHRATYLVGHRIVADRGLEMAALLASAPDALISHRSAARLWNLLPANAAQPIDITIVAKEAHPQPGIAIHRTAAMEEVDICEQGPIRLTTPARTLLDLAAILPLSGLESAVAQALRSRPPLIAPADLADQVRRNHGRRGVARLRHVAGLDGGPQYTHEGAERRMLALVRAYDLPPPEANERVNGFEVDFVWRRERVIVEIDSRRFHADDLAYERDRLRDAELIAAGWVVIRVTWRRLTTEPAAVAGRIRRTLEARVPVEVAPTRA